MDSPKITVLCLAYNHASYIKDALEGFVSQETRFPFEVIVHDDASTDGTADIIREYARRYPEIIKPVFQKENQYSRGVAIGPTFCFPLVRGEYVALCEGDDYWTDPLKLQLQADALDAHPEVDLCTHGALVTQNGKFHGYMPSRLWGGILSADKIIRGMRLPTASLLIRREAYLRRTPPREILFNDTALLLQACMRGGALYLPRCMSVYRYQTPGSWSAVHRGQARMDARKTEQAQLEAFDQWTEGRFHRAVLWRTTRNDTSDLLARRDYAALLKPRHLALLLQRLGKTLHKYFVNLASLYRWKRFL